MYRFEIEAYCTGFSLPSFLTTMPWGKKLKVIFNTNLSNINLI